MPAARHDSKALKATQKMPSCLQHAMAAKNSKPPKRQRLSTVSCEAEGGAGAPQGRLAHTRIGQHDCNPTAPMPQVEIGAKIRLCQYANMSTLFHVDQAQGAPGRGRRVRQRRPWAVRRARAPATPWGRPPPAAPLSASCAIHARSSRVEVCPRGGCCRAVLPLAGCMES